MRVVNAFRTYGQIGNKFFPYYYLVYIVVKLSVKEQIQDNLQ